jgi:hypothetical protein
MNRIAQRSAQFVDLDVHAETISVAIAKKNDEVRSIGSIPNRPESIERLGAKLDAGGAWTACYEAGPTATSTSHWLPSWRRRRYTEGRSESAHRLRLLPVVDAGSAPNKQ